MLRRCVTRAAELKQPHLVAYARLALARSEMEVSLPRGYVTVLIVKYSEVLSPQS